MNGGNLGENGKVGIFMWIADQVNCLLLFVAWFRVVEASNST